MKAAVVSQAGSQWEIKDIPLPEVGPNQLLIKMRASGVCYTDVHQTRGELPVTFPRILGHEPVGEVVEIGSSVTHRQVSDRVGVPGFHRSCGRCRWCLRNKKIFCPEIEITSFTIDGGHAEFMLADADATTLLPEGLSFEVAAPILCAGYTVWSGLRWAEPNPGDRVAVVGIGGLGHLAIQYAKAAGYETVAVSHSPQKHQMIREFGADAIVHSGEELSRIGGADVVLGTSNSAKAMADVIRGLRPDGKLVVMGLDTDLLPLSTQDLVFRRIKVIGSQQNHPTHLTEALELAATKKIKPLIETYPLDEAQKAYERVERGEVRFRAVLTM